MLLAVIPERELNHARSDTGNREPLPLCVKALTDRELGVFRDSPEGVQGDREPESGPSRRMIAGVRVVQPVNDPARLRQLRGEDAAARMVVAP